jgi:ketosteroid isomerase-like protein
MSKNTIDELTEIEHELAAAWVAGDHTFHERILAEDWSVIDPSGRVLTKAEVLSETSTGERSITEGEIDQIKVRDFGDWAVVTGRTRMAGSYQGQEMKVTLRFTDVFDRSSGEWRCVASQGTMVETEA